MKRNTDSDMDNVRPIRADIPIETDKDKEIVAHIADHLAQARRDGWHTLGIVSTTFFLDKNNNIRVKTTWDVGDVPAPNEMVLTYAAAHMARDAISRDED